MQIEEVIRQITAIDTECAVKAQERFDNLIKPVGSLAKLESMVTRYAAIIGKYDKNELNYPKKGLLIWGSIEQAAEAEKIMLGKWPVNILAAETGAQAVPLLVTAADEAEALAEGAILVKEHVAKDKLEMLGLGCLSDNDELVIDAMAGAILQAAALKVPVMLDGAATCRALVKAMELNPLVKEYCFAGHVSLENGMEQLLEKVQLSAPLRLNITDGCGEGAAIAFTLFDAGLKAYKEMETFAEAGVHAEMKEFSHAEQVKEEQRK